MRVGVRPESGSTEGDGEGLPVGRRPLTGPIVDAIHRYPVKGIGGERLASTALTEFGIPFDRALALPTGALPLQPHGTWTTYAAFHTLIGKAELHAVPRASSPSRPPDKWTAMRVAPRASRLPVQGMVSFASPLRRGASARPGGGLWAALSESRVAPVHLGVSCGMSRMPMSRSSTSPRSGRCPSDWASTSTRPDSEPTSTWRACPPGRSSNGSVASCRSVRPSSRSSRPSNAAAPRVRSPEGPSGTSTSRPPWPATSGMPSVASMPGSHVPASCLSPMESPSPTIFRC